MESVRKLSNSFLERLDAAAERVGDKPAFVSEKASLTYAQLRQQAEAVGSGLAALLPPRQAVAVLMGREVFTVAAILGAAEAGCFAAPLDPSMPPERLLRVFETLNPAAVVADASAQALIDALADTLPCPVLPYDRLRQTPADPALLLERREGVSSTDPVEILYTSGSTGLPKGVVYAHGGVLSYVDRALDFADLVNERQICGNQAPFFYANSINDVFLAINNGCTVELIPDGCFLFPRSFVEFLNQKKITSLVMTPLNYVYIAAGGVLEPGCLPYLQSIYFSGEVVGAETLAQWAQAAPGAACYNIYGATETPYTAQYLLTGQTLAPGQAAPAGRPLRGARVLILDENGDQTPAGTAGELYVTSPWLSKGYYRDRARTEAAYLRDPLGFGWDQTYYRTGDLGCWDEAGNLMVLGRRDSQIKHRGYRMDLGEVDAALRAIEGWQNGCCLQSPDTDRLCCFWCGPLTQAELQAALAGQLERYKLPNDYVHLEALPRTASGKLDRMALRQCFPE